MKEFQNNDNDNNLHHGLRVGFALPQQPPDGLW